MKTALRPLNVKEVKGLLGKDDIIILIQELLRIYSGFIPGSIFIGLEGRFAEWAGSFCRLIKDLVMVTEIGQRKGSYCALSTRWI